MKEQRSLECVHAGYVVFGEPGGGKRAPQSQQESGLHTRTIAIQSEVTDCKSSAHPHKSIFSSLDFFRVVLGLAEHPQSVSLNLIRGILSDRPLCSRHTTPALHPLDGLPPPHPGLRSQTPEPQRGASQAQTSCPGPQASPCLVALNQESLHASPVRGRGWPKERKQHSASRARRYFWGN